MLVAGLTGRVLTDSATVFLLLTFLSLAGMATTNVLLPSLVKRHFPDRIGVMTAIYTTALAIGLTAAFTLTVPFSRSAGDLVVAPRAGSLGGTRRRGGPALVPAVAARPHRAR